MLTHTVLRTRDGRHQVVYQTPGCTVPTPVCSCSTEEQALAESERLNQEQLDREAAMAEERRLCGLWRIQAETINHEERA
jgi:hypothetical protein